MAVLQIANFITLLLITSSSSTLPKERNGTVRLVSVLFRHGDRTTDVATTWPKDPYKNETYFPYGIGQLTNKGKQREYRLGKKLRSRYDKFLGRLYTPNVLDAVSTEYNRTKMSLELVLASLYPPRGTSVEWERELNWQPIPYNYLLAANDRLMSFPLYFCPKYVELYEAYTKTPEAQEIERKYSEQYSYLSRHTGLNVTSISDLILIYFGLTSQKEWGFRLPDWAHRVYPEYLESAAAEFYIFATATTELKQLTGGYLLKKIISDTQLKLDGKLIPQDRKIFLYSGHEINVAYLLRAMEVFFPHVPPYGACVIIEVQTINYVDGIRIYYEDYSQTSPKLLKVPGCDYFCPFKQFVELLGKNLPASGDICNEDLHLLYKHADSINRYWGVYT